LYFTLQARTAIDYLKSVEIYWNAKCPDKKTPRKRDSMT